MYLQVSLSDSFLPLTRARCRFCTSRAAFAKQLRGTERSPSAFFGCTCKLHNILRIVSIRLNHLHHVGASICATSGEWPCTNNPASSQWRVVHWDSMSSITDSVNAVADCAGSVSDTQRSFQLRTSSSVQLGASSDAASRFASSIRAICTMVHRWNTQLSQRRMCTCSAPKFCASMLPAYASTMPKTPPSAFATLPNISWHEQLAERPGQSEHMRQPSIVRTRSITMQRNACTEASGSWATIR